MQVCFEFLDDSKCSLICNVKGPVCKALTSEVANCGVYLVPGVGYAGSHQIIG